MNHIVYLALGTNLGNRAANLKAAIDSLEPQMHVLKKSPIYETPPWGYEDQAAFLNMAIKADTYVEPLPLLKHLKRLEIVLGRVPSVQNGPRLIDIDLLFYDDRIVFTEGIIVPHPRLHERGFVLVPMNDIAPDFIHPVLKKTIRELFLLCNTNGIIPYS